MERLVALGGHLQAALAIAIAADSLVTVLLLGMLGAATVALVVTAWRAVPALVAADASGASRRHRQTADPGRLIAQSDPDAAGRPRPRAPGRRAAAA